MRKWLPSGPDALECLLGDLDVFRSEHWRRKALVRSAGMDFSELVSEARIWDELHHGLLAPPYVVTLVGGVRAEASSFTENRTVGGHASSGHASGAAVAEHFASGSTVKLNNLEHWLPAVSELVAIVEATFDCHSETFAFLSPPGRAALKAHTDGTNLLVLQISGRKSWEIEPIDENSVSTEGVHGDGTIAPDRAVRFDLHPGDVLYMPHGTPHRALAQEEQSLHLTVTIEEPRPGDILRELIESASLSASGRDLKERWTQLPAAERIPEARRVLVEEAVRARLAPDAS